MPWEGPARRRALSVALSLVALFSMAGCIARLPAPSTHVEALRAKAVVSVVEDAGPGASAQTSAQTSAQASAKTSAKISGRATITAMPPGSFRIDVSGPLGISAFIAAFDGKTLYVYSNGRVVEHRDSDAEAVLGFPPRTVYAAITNDRAALKALGPEYSAFERADKSFELTRFSNGIASAVIKMDDKTQDLSDGAGGRQGTVSVSHLAQRREIIIKILEMAPVSDALTSGFFRLSDPRAAE